jgi:hypothetical protein
MLVLSSSQFDPKRPSTLQIPSPWRKRTPSGVEKQPKNVRDSASKKTSQGLRDNFLDALQAKFEVSSASLI